MTKSKLEIAQLYFESGDLLKTVSYLEELTPLLLESKDYKSYLEGLNTLLRCYVELLEAEKINRIQAQLLELTQSEQFTISSRTYYTLSFCAFARDQFEESLALSHKALDLATTLKNREDIAYALSGLALSYYGLNKLQESLKEIYNIQVLLSLMEIPRINLSMSILKGQILRKLGKYDQALDIFWQCYDLLKTNKNFYTYFSLLSIMGLTYKQAKSYTNARHYLMLASRTIDKNNFKRLNKSIHRQLRELGEESSLMDCDIFYDIDKNIVIENSKGKIDFKHQFILLELLKILISNPGEVFSKEEIVRVVWKQSYSPAVHDNKIYVTVKRLRHLIEPNVNTPRYIFRSKNGYFFNPEARTKTSSNMYMGEL